MAAARKMDELLVSWLSNDATYESIMDLIDIYKAQQHQQLLEEAEDTMQQLSVDMTKDGETTAADPYDYNVDVVNDNNAPSSPRGVIPPFYPSPTPRQRRHLQKASSSSLLQPQQDCWEPPLEDELLPSEGVTALSLEDAAATPDAAAVPRIGIRDLAVKLYQELGLDLPADSSDDSPRKYMLPEHFVRITKEVLRFPSFFNAPLYLRILELWNQHQQQPQAISEAATPTMEVITLDMLEWYYKTELEPYDMDDRFFRLVKQPFRNYIQRDDFLPFIKALLADHPGLEFLSTSLHASFIA
jgi:hypothetical protein